MHIEELPQLNLPLHNEVVHFPQRSTDRAVFLKIKIISDRLGIIYYPVIYAFSENETFYCNKLAPNNATTTHIIHVRYGFGLGGGEASGVWLLNVLEKLNCELYITDGLQQDKWRAGDNFALKFCSSIPKQSDARLTRIRVVRSIHWPRYGYVSWYKVT